MSGSAKAGTIAERHACELRVLPEFAVRAPPKRASGESFFSLTKTYMDVRFCEGRNHRREARVRAAGSARVRRARSSEARLRRIFFLLDEDLHGCRQTFHHQVRERLPRNPAGELNSVTPAINSQWGCVLKQSPLVYMGSNRPSLT